MNYLPAIAEEFSMKIVVYAIAKNEEKFVRRFMESCKDADAVYIRDTGSTDNTVKLALELGAVVQCGPVIPWRFDTARNESLSLVPDDVDVCIALDLDEVLLPGWRQALTAAWNKQTHRWRYKYVWSHKSDGTPDLVYYGDKIHCRHGFTWHHPVHEVMKFSGTELQSFIPDHITLIEHFPDPTKSRGSYLPLLELAVKEDPEDDRNAHYLGRELVFVGRLDEAEAELKRHLSLPRAKWEAERAASMRYLAQVCDKKGDQAMRQRWLLRAVAEAPNEREPWVELAQAYYTAQNFHGMFYAAKQALAITSRPSSYMSQAFAWGEVPHDLGALGAWYSGAKFPALCMAMEALRHNPTDARLQANLKCIESGMVDPYCTHQRVLVAALAQTTGPVLELGCGHYSTPLLHAYCASTDRPLLTVETDSAWGEMFSHLAGNGHQFRLGPYDPKTLGAGWGLVFVDGAVGTRAPAIRELYPESEMLVIHDTEDPRYGYEAVLKDVAWQVTDKSRRPWTTVISRVPRTDFRF